jgi:hypothetical protein
VLLVIASKKRVKTKHFKMIGLFVPHFALIFQITFQLILWLLPTFFWTGEALPVNPLFPKNKLKTDGLESKGLSLVEHISRSPPVEAYNALLCPQCVQRHLTAAAVGVSYVTPAVG